MAENRFITIKGVKDGLIFLFDDTCEFSELIEDLQNKLENTHHQILTGPIIHIHIKLGKRSITEEQEQQIRQLFLQQGNLSIKTIESDVPEKLDMLSNKQYFQICRGKIRSGQTLQFDGSVLYVGDVHPGGTIICTGDIYIMGSLRGLAHAGSNGDDTSIIAASSMRPTQLRIADVISRPPDEWGVSDADMEFAYLQGQTMEINKISYLSKIRPGADLFELKESE